MLNVHPVILEDLDTIIQEKIEWEKLRNSTVMITGANGMIASYICWTLLRLNDKYNFNIKVVGLVRNFEKAKTKFANNLERNDFEIVVQDVCEKITYTNKIDYIIHAASQTSPHQFLNNPVETLNTNTIGTKNMLELGVDKEVKGFMCLSTREIYGTMQNGQRFVKENELGAMDPALVRSCYPEGKRVSETFCIAYKEQYGLNCKIARIAHTYGPGMEISDGRVVGDFLGNVINKENIIMNSDGSNVLALTYISDVIGGLLRLLLEFKDTTYNISSNKSILTVKELAVKLVNIFSDRNMDIEFKALDEKMSQGYLKNIVPLLDSNKAYEENWETSIGIEEGFKRTVRYYEE